MNYTRLLFSSVLVLVLGLLFTGQTFAQCTAKSRYCTRQGQRTDKGPRAPFAASQVPEAATGFQHPLGKVRFSTNSSGNGFAQKDTVSYPSCGTIYHPGLDLNWGSGNADCGSDIGSIADGVVVWIGGNSDWQGLMVQHKYKGEMIIAAYGHVVEIDPNLDVGDTVKKGQYLARVGAVKAVTCHLHLEIRRVSSHPSPMEGLFFCKNGREKDVRAWYHDPEPFIDSRPAYAVKPSISLSVPNSPVRRTGLRSYEFTVGVRETGGQPQNVDYVYLDGEKFTGKQFFGTSKLKAFGSLSKKVTLKRVLLRDKVITYKIQIWNSVGRRYETWTKSITLRRSL